MDNEYDHKSIEEKWQERWEQKNLYETPDDPDPANAQYVLGMFPYPSGSGLHVGHVESFTGTDVYARFLRMQGKDVLFPMGWDAFGLPAENYAIKTGTHPRERTEETIPVFKNQLQSLGLSYDWDREINTSSPEYYKWTQWLFTTLFEQGLAEKKPDAVNWCPSCQTVLANAQVIDDLCERCDTEVEEREMDQWFFNITEYADELIDDLDELDWPESTKELQRNWIGRQEGAVFTFPLQTNQSKRFVILHGYKSGPDKHFHPWLKEKLEVNGHEVIMPKLPQPDDPDVSEQVAYLKENIELTEDTVLVGHSLGTIVAMKVLEQLDHSVKTTFLIAPYTDTEFADGKTRGYEDTTDWEFDFAKIRDNAGQLINLRPTEDTSISDAQYRRAKEELGGSWTEIDVNKPHAKGEKEPGIFNNLSDQLSVFTTRADTLYGVTYLALSPEHQEIRNLKSEIRNWEEVKEYVKKTQNKTDRERQEAENKTGVKLEGVTAEHPATGEELPVFVADYVLPEYGTGAIMAVPAHDKRDYAFAKEHKDEIAKSVKPEFGKKRENEETSDGGVGVIFSEERQKYAVAESPTGEYRLLGGGVEEGETLEEAAWREIAEESGFQNFSYRDTVGECVAHYYNPVKESAKAANTICVFGVLKDEAQDETDREDHEDYNIVWKTPEEILENWNEKNENNDYDHSIWQLKKGVNRAIEEGYDHTNDPYPDSHDVIRQVISSDQNDDGEVYVGEGKLINSGDFSGLDSGAAAEKITEEYGYAQTTYKLQDWSLGRQRYWGAPIPIVYDPDGKPHPVPEKHLPWELPQDVDFEPTGEPPLAKSDELKERTEEIFGAGWTPETETMDTFVDSSWYFLRYPDPDNDKQFASKAALDTWCPVDMYIGGAEHAVLHLLYARFITKALADADEIDFREPFASLRHQGMVLAEDGTKMSKSKGNVVNPNAVVDQVGADTLRMYELFAGPFSEDFDWDTDAIAGPRRFIERVWRMFADNDPDLEPVDQPPENDTLMHQTVRDVTEDIAAFKFNTAISSLMEARNVLDDRNSVSTETLSVFIRLLAPFAPHVAEELWGQNEGVGSVHQQGWPVFSADAAQEDTVDIAVQIDGTVRGEMTVDKNTDEEEIVAKAKQLDNVQKHLQDITITRHIYVPEQLINFVSEK